MKTISVGEAQGQLARLISEANQGEIIVIRDGDKEATLSSASAIPSEVDFPELEAELLRAANGPFTPYSSDEMRDIGERIIKEHRATQGNR